MREFKFRAWDKERKEMRQVQLMDFSAWWVSTGSSWERGNALEYGERNSFQNEETDRHILMQYTGLKDKNGIEIYEGDLIQDNLGYGAVEYRETRAGFRLNYVDGLAKWFLDYTDDEFKTIEVIGNVYETHSEVSP